MYRYILPFNVTSNIMYAWWYVTTLWHGHDTSQHTVAYISFIYIVSQQSAICLIWWRISIIASLALPFFSSVRPSCSHSIGSFFVFVRNMLIYLFTYRHTFLDSFWFLLPSLLQTHLLTLLHSLTPHMYASHTLHHSPSLSLSACITHSPPLTHFPPLSTCITHSLRASYSQILGSQNLGHTISRIIPILRESSVQWCYIMLDTALRQQMETV